MLILPVSRKTAVSGETKTSLIVYPEPGVAWANAHIESNSEECTLVVAIKVDGLIPPLVLDVRLKVAESAIIKGQGIAGLHQEGIHFELFKRRFRDLGYIA